MRSSIETEEAANMGVAVLRSNGGFISIGLVDLEIDADLALVKSNSEGN